MRCADDHTILIHSLDRSLMTICRWQREVFFFCHVIYTRLLPWARMDITQYVSFGIHVGRMKFVRCSKLFQPSIQSPSESPSLSYGIEPLSDHQTAIIDGTWIEMSSIRPYYIDRSVFLRPNESAHNGSSLSPTDHNAMIVDRKSSAPAFEQFTDIDHAVVRRPKERPLSSVLRLCSFDKTFACDLLAIVYVACHGTYSTQGS